MYDASGVLQFYPHASEGSCLVSIQSQASGSRGRFAPQPPETLMGINACDGPNKAAPWMPRRLEKEAEMSGHETPTVVLPMRSDSRGNHLGA